MFSPYFSPYPPQQQHVGRFLLPTIDTPPKNSCFLVGKRYNRDTETPKKAAGHSKAPISLCPYVKRLLRSTQWSMTTPYSHYTHFAPFFKSAQQNAGGGIMGRLCYALMESRRCWAIRSAPLFQRFRRTRAGRAVPPVNRRAARSVDFVGNPYEYWEE